MIRTNGFVEWLGFVWMSYEFPLRLSPENGALNKYHMLPSRELYLISEPHYHAHLCDEKTLSNLKINIRDNVPRQMTFSNVYQYWISRLKHELDNTTRVRGTKIKWALQTQVK